MKTGHDPLAIAIADALLHERAQRRMAAQDAANPSNIAAAQLAVEGHPIDAASFDAAAHELARPVPKE